MLTSGKVNKHPTKPYFFQSKTPLHSQKTGEKKVRKMLITFVDK